MHTTKDASNFSNKLLAYLQQVDYRIAEEPEERDAIFKLRHKAYLSEGAIKPMAGGIFRDAYDDMDNCWNFGVFVDGMMVSAVRCHLITPDMPYGPALDFFPDVIRPLLDEGKLLVDPTRFVASKAMSAIYPEIPYITLRAACMTYDHFDADLCLASVRQEHRAFYRRVFRADILCEPRPYPPLTVRLGLMATNVASFREQLLRRYPIFESSYTERRLLFGGGGGPLRHRLSAEQQQAAVFGLS
ncbi:MAG: hypothetical protein QNJ29_13390 [Rhizobiaceae bacterium]|nr:hypothetical protein [Rhizobiaceae bacterium]